MPSNYFFVDAPFFEGSSLLLEGDEYHHAKDVMRTREKEKLSLFNGKGEEATASVRAIEKGKIWLEVQSVVHHLPKPQTLTLGISLLRPGHLDFVVEKGTELGVQRFLFFPADLSERKEVSFALQRRLHAITVAALKQSGCFFLPLLVYCRSLQEALSLAAGVPLWADIASDAKTLSELSLPAKENKKLTLFIGPEAGWSEKERKIFRESGPPICLHDTILRAETAALVGAYAVLHWLSPSVKKHD